MRLDELKTPKGSRKKKKRIGRGEGSGHGGTSTKGHKGRKARSGGMTPPGFEGGQMPLQRRLPKRGFKNPFRKEFAIVNVGDLMRFPAQEVITAEKLETAGLLKKQSRTQLKILGNGSISHPFIVRAHHFSLAAKNKIEAAGGKAEVI